MEITELSSDIQSLLPTTIEEVESESTENLSFIPNLILISSGNTRCKTDPDKYKEGEYCIGRDTPIGKDFPVVVITQRFHAILFENRKKTCESFIKNSEDYLKIKSTPKKGMKINPRYGVEWLLWLPEQRQWVVFLLGADSTRALSDKIMTYVTPQDQRNSPSDAALPHTRAFILGSRMRTMGQYLVMVPTVTPTDIDENWQPSQESANHNINLFVDEILREKNQEKATDDDDR